SDASLRSLWTNRYIWLVTAIFFMNNVLFYIETGWLPVFFQAKGLLPTQAAFTVSVLGLVSIPAILLIPFCSDRIGLRKPFLWVSGLASAAAAYGLVFSPTILDAVFMGILGATVAALFMIPLFLSIDLVEPRMVGSATGMIVSVGYLGGVVGPWTMGLITDIAGGFGHIPITLIIASIVAALIALAMPETGRRRST
ncbi:MAG: CynX/NimT family MFS transporter, partial [Candidatus Bathyarchaeia archaeon]